MYAIRSYYDAEEDVLQVVREIIADVRKRGDAALCDYGKRFDRIELSPGSLRVDESEIDAAESAVAPEQHESYNFV